MRNFFITTLAAFAITVSAFANPVKVNHAILSNFNTQFKAAADVTWYITKDYTKAEFTTDNKKMEVYYNFNGDIIGTSRNVALDDLPVNAKRNFAKKFSGYEVKEAIRFEGFDESAYYISGEDEKESVIIKVNDHNQVSIFKRTKK
jgi:calcineurin-like phosphoesterase family protein